jgi:hypothetical protein
MFLLKSLNISVSKGGGKLLCGLIFSLCLSNCIFNCSAFMSCYVRFPSFCCSLTATSLWMVSDECSVLV